MQRVVALCLALVVSSGPSLVRAQQGEVIPYAQDRPPGPALSPTEAVAKMTVPEGFSVEVVASEPDLVNPVAMTFDERGRVWITESLEYPRKSQGPGRDRVKVLEDTDGDGKADKFTIFAEGLNIPSGIAVGHGGVWVANSPDILFLQDTDGDGRADKSEVVVTGFGRDDTHELPNSLTWGPDGWLYGWNGVFNRSHVSHRGKDYHFTCAIFRIHPRTRDFELFCEGTSNPWGIAIDPEGALFASACVIDHLWHLVETGYYHRQGGPYPPFTWKIESIVDHKHQKAAYCGVHYFDSDAYPPKYRGRLYMGNIHGNCINVDILEKHGSTYRARPAPDFLTAHDAWFMPVSQKTGPDGSLYILDWYDRYHCYQDANRDPAGIDRLKGRLYRVRYKETPRRVGFDLSKENDDSLIQRLGHANIYDREIAQRLLVERLASGRSGAETRGKLERRVLDRAAPGSGQERAATHALWVLVGSGPLAPGFHLRLLDHDKPTFRAWGVRAAGNQRRVDAQVREKVIAMARDPAPAVRLQVAIASRKVEGLDPMPALLGVIADPEDDPLLARVVWQNLHPLLEGQADAFVRVLERDDLRRTPGLTAIVPRAVERLLAQREADPAPIAALLSRLIATAGVEPVVTARALGVLTAKLQGNEVSSRVSQALRDRLRQPLHSLFRTAEDETLLGETGLLLTTWGDPLALASTRKAVHTNALSEAMRLRALDTLVFVDPGATIALVVQLALDPETGPIELRGRMVAALGRIDEPRVADAVLAAFPKLEPDLRPRAVDLLTQRPSWGLALLDAVARQQVPPEALNANQVRKLLAGKNPKIARRVTAHWGTIREGRDPGREKVVNEMRAFLKRTPGDPIAGQKVFQKLCAQCHKIYGEGQDVGPDITGIGRSDFEQLLSNVFDPSLVIGASYQATTVATRDGRVLTGLLAENSPDRVILKVQGGKSETVPRSEVEALKVSPLSLMPEDIETQLSRQEWADLFSFLSLDKPPGDPSARRLPGTPDPKPSGER